MLGPLGIVPLYSKWWIAFGAPDETLVWRMIEERRRASQSMRERAARLRASVWR
jgi:hypothetical protein